MSGRSRDGDVTGDNAPSFPGDAATAAEVCRTDLAADDAVCLSATDTRGDRGGDLGDIGGEFTGEDAASSSLNANGPPDAVCVVGFIEVRGEVRGDRRGEAGGDDVERSDGVTLELGERGDLGGDGAGDIAGDLAGEAAGALDLAGDLATGDLATECVVGRVPDDDARPLAYCVCLSTRETLRFGVVLAPHAGLGVVLGLGAGAGSYGERAPEDEGGGGVVLSSALRLAGDAGAPWNRDAPVPTVPLAGAECRGAEPGGGFAFDRALRVFRPSEDIPNVDDVGILAPPTARRLSSVCASPRLLQQFQSKRLKTEARKKWTTTRPPRTRVSPGHDVHVTRIRDAHPLGRTRARYLAAASPSGVVSCGIVFLLGGHHRVARARAMYARDGEGPSMHRDAEGDDRGGDSGARGAQPERSALGQ